MKSILICTQYKGVFYGEVPADTDLTPKMLTDIKNARMVFNWRNEKGVMGLASDGPDDRCKWGEPADIEVLHDITAIFNVTDKAKSAWNRENQ